jgi:class 3 adenylate cyclase/tetratricopeptide (TPR) repeat protein
MVHVVIFWCIDCLTQGWPHRSVIMTSLGQWLDSVGLGQYAGAFEQHAIGWDVLPNLNHSILKDVGINAAGDRVRILTAISSLQAPDTNPQILVPDKLLARHPSAGEAERRNLTVLFCDLAGYTELAHRQDPEDLRDLLGTYQDVCQSAIKRYEGFVARYAGDGVLAYFGYPQAHEENAERSVRAGLAIIDGMRALNLQLAERKVELNVRIGIATGTVVVGDVIGEGASQESTVLGETPNVASRLQALAQPNTVVIGPETRRLAYEYFEYRDLGEQLFKGLAAPVQAWEVLRERASELRFDMRQGAGATPLVGRTEELALILRRWGRAKDGEGQVALLSGEPGIGKSRLAQTVCESISVEPHNLIRYQCSPYHTNSALYPIAEQIRRTAGIDASDDADSQLTKLEMLLRLAFDDVSEVTPLFAALLSINVGNHYAAPSLRFAALKDATLKALTGYIFALSAKHPTLLIVEDAHWIDPTTKEALDLLLRGIAKKPVLVVITCRPDYRPSWSGLASALTLPIVRLPRRDVALMIDKMLGGKPLAQEVLEQIVAKADGVPLFVEELTKTVVESSQIVETSDSYRLDGALSELAIPTTIRDSLMARLDGAASMREVAQVGACIGRLFSRDLLAAVLAVEGLTLDSALHQLETAGLLFRTGPSRQASYVFKHALVRDAAYDSLLKSRRKQFHARIAEVLAESGDAVAAAPEVLAYHSMEAGEFERAAAHWYEAAKRAGARYANQEAIAHCSKGLAALSQLPRTAERTRTELALRITLADSLRMSDRHNEALAELGTARAIANESEHGLELSRIHHMRGNIQYPLGKAQTCFAEHEAAWHFAKKSKSVEDEARALGGLGDAHFLAGRIQQAHKHFDRCVALSRSNDLVLTEVAYLPMRAVTHMYCLRFQEALKDCDAVADLAARIGQARGELISRSTSSWILLDRGELPQAEEHARKGLEAVKVIGARRFIPLFNDVIARIRLDAGDRNGALEVLEESWSVCREAGVAFAGPVVLGAVALATTDAERRLEALRQGEAILQEGCASHNHFRFYRDAIEIGLRERLWDNAESYARTLQSYFGAEASPWSDFVVARSRALAAAARPGSNVTAITQLRKLRDYAAHVGMLATVSRFDQALEEV